MGVLRTLLNEIEGDNNLEKMRQMCDKIAEEEKMNITHQQILPKGPNLFIVLEVPGRISEEIAFLALERESENIWLAVLFTTTVKEFKLREENPPSIKRQRVWEINDSRPEIILTEYAKRYKFLRGE
jgi:hypothetical protein